MWANRSVTSTLLLGENALLAVTAASKWILYINRFGWTSSRVISLWVVFVLLFGCIFALVHVLTSRRMFDKWGWLSAGTLALICFY